MAIFGVVGGLALAFTVLYGKSLRTLQLANDDLLLPTEVVKKQTQLNVVYYRTGRPLRFWEAAGGKLFLTTSRLIFKAHPDQPWAFWACDRALPLDEIVLVGQLPRQ